MEKMAAWTQASRKGQGGVFMCLNDVQWSQLLIHVGVQWCVNAGVCFFKEILLALTLSWLSEAKRPQRKCKEDVLYVVFVTGSQEPCLNILCICHL